METATETIAIERELSIDASPETVWEFLVDPDKATRWMGMSAVLDVTPGGAYSIEVIPGSTASGAFVEIERPRRLVYTWGWEPGAAGEGGSVPPGSTTVEIDLVADGDGTTLRFVHRLTGEKAAESHAHGWDHYLPRLASAAAGGDPGPDPWVSGDM